MLIRLRERPTKPGVPHFLQHMRQDYLVVFHTVSPLGSVPVNLDYQVDASVRTLPGRIS